jgi:hypothetical protein
MTKFVDAIVADLTAFSGHLLDRGLAASGPTLLLVPGTVAGSTSAVIRVATTLSRLTPSLVDDVAESVDDLRQLEVAWTASPKGARASRSPGDFQRQDGRTVPRRFARLVPARSPDVPPLRWLLHLQEAVRGFVDSTLSRTTKFIDDARRTRVIESKWGRADAVALDELHDSLLAARCALERSETQTRRVLGEPNARPLRAVPQSLPGTQSWRTLRRLSPTIMAPNLALPELLRDTLARPIPAADVPFLYQRWCGMKMLDVLGELGWQLRSDPVGALFLGGRIPLARGSASMVLWVEPRLGVARHESGFCAVQGEQQPDFLIVTSGQGGFDAFTLDPTTSWSTELIESKGRYLESICCSQPSLVSGVLRQRRPQRAWAAAPLHDRRCNLFDHAGRTGVVPMSPVGWYSEPLKQWLSDVSQHARAWAGNSLA